VRASGGERTEGRPDVAGRIAQEADGAVRGARRSIAGVDETKGPGVTDAQRAVAEAAAYIERHADEPITLASLAAVVSLSPSHLQRAFTSAYGRSPKRYQTVLRAEALKRGLRNGATVSEAGYDAGFGSTRGVYEGASREIGMSPAQYRGGGGGLEIRYTVVPSALGGVLVGRTQRGVCAVLLDDAERLEADLAQEFPRARLVRDDEGLREWAAAVVEAVAGHASTSPVPLDLQGTEFQRRVWAELQRVPIGETASYAEIAARIGRPSATRAVAGACAGNHVAVVVPCHRVVRTDGGLGGYKWGVERKQALLESEKAASERG
jgi:AraC family transcriptional regulator, regulatory protein of adaptative response / methylated-DNA-[protein]-cysteine methyltransferase